MFELFNKETQRVFENFQRLSKIPRGSENMKPIADFCTDFAKANGLDFIRDAFDNVIIFKNGSKGYEDKEPIILQGHLDMVCQQTADSKHDFSKRGPEIYTDGDFLKANKTTLGADNGIAVAIIMTILESNTLKHPPIEAVFTTDEEIGMVGAIALDTTPLKGKRLINLDSEEDDVITVSCAGGSDLKISLETEYEAFTGYEVTVKIDGLKGGHSGVEINKGRCNANILAGRFLNSVKKQTDFRLCEISGGDKSNAITRECTVKLIVTDLEKFSSAAAECLETVKKEISAREPDFSFKLEKGKRDTFKPFTSSLTEKIIFLLLNAPFGVITMSAEIEGLVETSTNLGILNTDCNAVNVVFSLRSNKSSALIHLEEKLTSIANIIGGQVETGSHYPPWEFVPASRLQEIYIKAYEDFNGFSPKVEAIHAGLECGVFSSKIEGLSCIAVGPTMYDVHTVNERLSISSAEKFSRLLFTVLEKL